VWQPWGLAADEEEPSLVAMRIPAPPADIGETARSEGERLDMALRAAAVAGLMRGECLSVSSYACIRDGHARGAALVCGLLTESADRRPAVQVALQGR
jgi:hypothetical protein